MNPLHYSVFCTRDGLGNHVAVYPEPVEDNEAVRQELALASGTSISVFIDRKSDESSKVSFYSAEREVPHSVDGCLALAHYASSVSPEMRFYSKQHPIFFESTLTDSGEEIFATELFQPDFSPLLEWVAIKKILEAMDLDERFLDRSLPHAVASWGLPTLFLPVVSVEQLQGLEPHEGDLERLCDTNGIVAVHLYIALGPRHFASRTFAPLLGAPELPISGTANGVLAAILSRAEVFPKREEFTTLKFSSLALATDEPLVFARVQKSSTSKSTRYYIGGKVISAPQP